MDHPTAASEEGPFRKLDPAKLRFEAEAKEKKLARKKAAAEERKTARKEKRHEKAAAKAARRANVKRAAKWTGERKLLDKQKKLANRPHKEEKRRRLMIRRAEKLEEQSKKLWLEAQKARARFAYLTELKEKEEAEKRTETAEYIPLNPGDDNDESVLFEEGQGATNTKGKSAVLSRLADRALLASEIAAAPIVVDAVVEAGSMELDVPRVNGASAGSTNGEAHDAESKPGALVSESGEQGAKSKKKKDKKRNKKEVFVFEDAKQENGLVEPKVVKEQETQPQVEAEPELPVQGVEEGKPKKEKKNKKRKREQNTEPEPVVEEIATAAEELAAEEPANKKAKKNKKNKKQKQEDNTEQEVEAEDVAPPATEAPTSKRSKKNKKAKKEQKGAGQNGAADEQGYGNTAAPAPQDTKADAPLAKWDVAGLSGGAARKDKYLRLLGAKKHGVTSADTAVEARDRDKRAALEDELERQYDVGVRMKLEGHGHHRGLGA